jgi:hypothetical protein
LILSTSSRSIHPRQGPAATTFSDHGRTSQKAAFRPAAMSLCGSLFHHDAQSVCTRTRTQLKLGLSEPAATSALQYAAAVQEEESVHVVRRMLLFSQKAAVPSGIGTRPHPGPTASSCSIVARVQVSLLLISSDRTCWIRLSVLLQRASALLGFSGRQHAGNRRTASTGIVHPSLSTTLSPSLNVVWAPFIAIARTDSLSSYTRTTNNPPSPPF